MYEKGECPKKKTAILFDYQNRDRLTDNARTAVVELPTAADAKPRAGQATAADTKPTAGQATAADAKLTARQATTADEKSVAATGKGAAD